MEIITLGSSALMIAFGYGILHYKVRVTKEKTDCLKTDMEKAIQELKRDMKDSQKENKADHEKLFDKIDDLKNTVLQNGHHP